MGAAAGVPVGGELSRRSPTASSRRRARRRPTARHRAARRADRRAHGRPGVQRRRLHRAAAKGMEAFGMVWAGWLYSQEWWRRELWKTTRRPERTLEQDIEARPPHLLPATRCQRPDPAGAHLGAARRRHDAGLQRRRRSGVALDHGAVPVHAVGDGPLFPARRRAVRERSSCRPCRSRRSRRSGAIPLAPAPNPEDEAFLNETIARFLAGRTQQR